MQFVQYYLECLSQASYLIGDETTGRAVIVDPMRDVAPYLADAAAKGLRIELVIETHVHADFLSGHLEMANATGATIVYGAGASVEFPYHAAVDGERIELGQVVLEIRATPGHTAESIVVVVWDRTDASPPYGVLTGDTLLVGDVGRPDLIASPGRSPADMASDLYRSLRTRLLTLPDDTKVYPGHGAGSACGKNLSSATASTIGEQRRTNYALQLHKIDDFIRAVTDGQPTRPHYFAHVADLNRRAHQLACYDEPVDLSLAEVADQQANGAVVLDVRPPDIFARAHLRGSLNVGLDGRFAEYVANIIDPGARIVIVGDRPEARQALLRLARVGHDNVVGALHQPTTALAQRGDLRRVATRLSARRLASALAAACPPVVLDVRTLSERGHGFIAGSVHIPIVELRRRVRELDPSASVVAYSAAGYRSSIAASWLRASGFSDVTVLAGGYQAYAAA